MPGKSDFDFLKDKLESHEERDEGRHREVMGQLSVLSDKLWKLLVLFALVSILGGPAVQEILAKVFPVAVATVGANNAGN